MLPILSPEAQHKVSHRKRIEKTTTSGRVGEGEGDGDGDGDGDVEGASLSSGSTFEAAGGSLPR